MPIRDSNHLYIVDFTFLILINIALIILDFLRFQVHLSPPRTRDPRSRQPFPFSPSDFGVTLSRVMLSVAVERQGRRKIEPTRKCHVNTSRKATRMVLFLVVMGVIALVCKAPAVTVVCLICALIAASKRSGRRRR